MKKRMVKDDMKKLSEWSVSVLKNGKVRAAFIIALVAVMFGTLMIVNLLTPPIGDDYDYSRWCVFEEDVLYHAFRFASYKYQLISGRAIVDFSTAVILSLFDKPGIAVINSLAYMLTVWLLYLIARGKGKNSICLFVGINLSLWVFVPELGQDIFWFSGAVGYLLPMVPILGMLLIYRRGVDVSSRDGVVKCVLVALLGVIAGWQLENSSIAVPFVTFAYICLWKYNKKKVPKWALCGFGGSVLGYILLITAPGITGRYRFETAKAESLSFLFKLSIITYYWIMFVGVLTALFLLGVIKCCRSNPGAALQGTIFAVAALGTAYCMVVAPSSQERTWFITVSLMTAAAGIVLKAAFPPEKASYGAKAILCTAALVILGTMAADTILATYDIHEQFVQREEMILTAKENGETVVYVPVYKLKYPLRANRYALHGLYDVELGENSMNSFNESVAQYYGVDAIIGTNGE